jgi:hypothetical protein
LPFCPMLALDHEPLLHAVGLGLHVWATTPGLFFEIESR